MAESSSSGGNGGGCGCGGCVMLVIFFFMVVAMWYGLPIGDKKWNIDLFPPRIWDMNAGPVESDKVAPVPVESEITTDTQAQEF